LGIVPVRPFIEKSRIQSPEAFDSDTSAGAVIFITLGY